jgi:hypothetical protein
MTFETPRTTEKVEGPKVRQFSVFLENKVGALLDVVKLLNEHNVEVIAVSVQDSSDSAIVRLIVSDPEQVQQLFESRPIAYQSTDVLVVELKEATQLAEMLTCLLMAEVNIHFCYPLLIRPGGRAALALHLEDDDCATAVLASHGFRILSQKDISR